MKTRQKVSRFMRDYQEIYGRGPTLTEIADAIPELNSKQAARYVVGELLKQGRIKLWMPTYCHRRYLIKELPW